MDKSTFTRDYRILLDLLKATRRAAGVTQTELAARLGSGQSLISKIERGEVRLDVIQLRTICLALQTSLPSLMQELDRRIVSAEHPRPPRKRQRPE